MNKFGVGSRVERVTHAKDYAHGRKGEIVEISPNKIRVSWDTNPDGSPLKPIRTWVSILGLKALDVDTAKEVPHSGSLEYPNN